MIPNSETLLCRDCFAEGVLGPVQTVRDSDGVPVKNEDGKFPHACAVCSKVVDGTETVLTMQAAIVALWACIYAMDKDALKATAQELLIALDEREAKQKAEEEANPKLKIANMIRRITGSL